MRDAKLNNLCSHYKDTFECHLVVVKQRDRLFVFLLAIFTFFVLQFSSVDLVNGVVKSYVGKQLGVDVEKNLNVLGVLVWFLLVALTTRYYQLALHVERQYDYLHRLEKVINRSYVGTCVFTREGASYLDDYPLFLSWMRFLYSVVFPLTVLLCIIARLYFEMMRYEVLGLSFVLCFVAYLLVGTSTVLYVSRLHMPLLRRITKSIEKGCLRIFGVVLGRRNKCESS